MRRFGSASFIWTMLALGPWSGAAAQAPITTKCGPCAVTYSYEAKTCEWKVSVTCDPPASSLLLPYVQTANGCVEKQEKKSSPVFVKLAIAPKASLHSGGKSCDEMPSTCDNLLYYSYSEIKICPPAVCGGKSLEECSAGGPALPSWGLPAFATLVVLAAARLLRHRLAA